VEAIVFTAISIVSVKKERLPVVDTLTTEQKTAIQNNNRLILVKAGAGTGKTEVLTRRVLHLLKQDQDLSIQEMAIITFTNKATENLVSRLKEYLYQLWKNESDPILKIRYRYELEGLNTANISTIHSFCKKILDSTGPMAFGDFQYSSNFTISGTALYTAIEDAFEQFLTEKRISREKVHHLSIMPVHEMKRIVTKSYNLIRTKGLDFSEVIQKTELSLLLELNDFSRKLKKELVDLLKKIFDLHYQYKLYSLDTDDLLEYCAKVLNRRKDICEVLQQKYKHIFIDEFQDTSAYQTQIIKALNPGTENGPNLFVVGDVKQSIYKFRGADLESYSGIEKWIETKGKVLSLSTNFRSTAELVRYVNHTFEKISKESIKYTFNPEPLLPKDNKEVINLTDAYDWVLAPTSAEQPEVAAAYIRKKVDLGVPVGKFAILFRRNYEILNYTQALSDKDIPFKIIGSGDLYNQKEIVDSYKLINLLLNPESLVLQEEAADTLFFNNNKLKIVSFLTEIKEIDLEYKTPAQVLDFIYKKLPIPSNKIKNIKQTKANLSKLKEVTRKLNFKENLSLLHFKHWLQTMITSHKDETQGDYSSEEGENDYVTLMTIHKAKGLEFPIVILPELDKQYTNNILRPPVVYDDNNGLEISYQKYYELGSNKTTIPSSNYESTIDLYKREHYSEELRVLYVALTRAEEQLVLIGSEDCPTSRICFQNWLKH
jgi:DNA helicase II / ATP-dependent DNA helicase PcrA